MKAITSIKHLARKIPTWGWVSAGLVAGAGLLYTIRKVPKGEVVALVSRIADEHGVPRRWAIAWVDLETGGTFDPDTLGDIDWPFRPCLTGRGCYERNVLGNPAYDGNPFRSDRESWISYGLFQLLSPYALEEAEDQGLVPWDSHPSVLLDPEVNAEVGIGKLAQQIAAGNDFTSARLNAAGCHAGHCRQAAKIIANAELVKTEYGIS